MSVTGFDKRQVLVLGERLAPVAREGLGEARFEIASAGRLDTVGSLHAAVELLLIDAEAADDASLVGALVALAQRQKPPAVLLAGAHLPAALARALMKLPRSDVLEPPFSSDDLARAASALLAEAAQPAQPAHVASARCWTVIGSVGGCGATTNAMELGAALARRSSARVAFVDLNLVDWAAAAYLGASANMTLAEASNAPERIDAALLEAFAARAGDGLDLFAAPRNPRAFADVSQTAVCRLLEVACQVYDWIVID
ncbi:MAG: AAA family ATPase, partial [Caulobacteraceae bacterium]